MAGSATTDPGVPNLRSGRVAIAAGALETIRQEIARTPKHLETGGILLGFHDPLTITVAGDAGPGAVRTERFFLRDLDHTQRLAAEELARSGAAWLGEWHTHPTGPPHPSPTDLATYDRLQRQSPDVFVAGVVALIAVPTLEVAAVTAWLSDGGTTVPLSIERSS